MKKIYKILSDHKYAIIWTGVYIFITWAILFFIFNFSIFNTAQWHKLAHAQLHGFAGFVFGILILSALPLYIATTTLIIRTKKPLVTIPVPQITLPKWPAKNKPTPVAEPTPTPEHNEQIQEDKKLPDELPLELHSVFIRAQSRINIAPIIPPQNTTDESTTTTSGTDDILPLPSDFDIKLDDIPGMNDAPSFDIPVFTDISFNTNDTDSNTITSTQDSTDISDLTEYLNKKNIEHSVHDDIVATPTHAIITHNDENFWVIDNENWFANGKTRPALQKTITEFATEHNLTPVIYLATKNIMDIDAHIEQWQHDDIIVITSPDELQE